MNTVASQNAAIRAGTEKNYNRYIWALAEAWTREKRLRTIDLCGGIDKPPGYESLDRGGAADIACDLDGRWPLEDSSVGLLRAHDALEHLKDPVHTMNEAYRVLAPGGFFMISVPSTNGVGAFCDPTHVSFWNRRSFRYYTEPGMAKYLSRFKGRFQASRVLEWYPHGQTPAAVVAALPEGASRVEIALALTEWAAQDNLPYVEAHLFCAKDGFRAMGPYSWGS